MKRALRNGRRRGVALLLAMGAVVVLMVMLTEFQDQTSAELAAAVAARDTMQAEYIAKSGVNLTRLLIASEPTVRKAVTPIFMMLGKTAPQLPVWEYSDRILGAFNGGDDRASFDSTFGVSSENGKNLGLKDGMFEVTSVDEDAKINVNLAAGNDLSHIRFARQLMGMMAPLQFNTMFETRDDNGNSHDRLATCQALVDWADNDESAFNCDLSATAANSGAEDGYYQALPKRYVRKNAAYDSLEELRAVRGVSDTFWGTFVDPEPNDPKKRVMTVWGQGKVNVNTANAQTLLALVCGGAPDAEMCTVPLQAEAFLAGVTLARGLSMGAPVFGNPKDFVTMMTGKGQLGPLLTTLGVKPVKFQSEGEFTKTIATESKIFSIYAVGVKKGAKRETRVRVHTVVDFRPYAPPVSYGSAAVSPVQSTADAAQGNLIYYRVE